MFDEIVESIIEELFDQTHLLQRIAAVDMNRGRITDFNTVQEAAKFGLNLENHVTTLMIEFNNKSNDTIRILVNKKENHLLFDDSRPLYVSFSAPYASGYDNTDAGDATTVVSTVMSVIKDVLETWKSSDQHAWFEKSKLPFIHIYAVQSNNINTATGVNNKEKERENTRRGNLYLHAYNKIIKPNFPEFRVRRAGSGNYEIGI